MATSIETCYRYNPTSCVTENPMNSERKIVEDTFNHSRSITAPRSHPSQIFECDKNVHEICQEIVLSNKDRDILLEAIQNPPQPNENLIKAYKKFHSKT